MEEDVFIVSKLHIIKFMQKVKHGREVNYIFISGISFEGQKVSKAL